MIWVNCHAMGPQVAAERGSIAAHPGFSEFFLIFIAGSP